MIGCLPTQAIAFEWKPGFTQYVTKPFHEIAVVIWTREPLLLKLAQLNLHLYNRDPLLGLNQPRYADSLRLCTLLNQMYST